MTVKEESEKGGLKLNSKKTKSMACSPITSWQTGEKVEVVTDFLFLGSKITAGGDCSHEIRTIASWNKSYDKPKQDFADKGLYSQGHGLFSSHVRM